MIICHVVTEDAAGSKDKRGHHEKVPAEPQSGSEEIRDKGSSGTSPVQADTLVSPAPVNSPPDDIGAVHVSSPVNVARKAVVEQSTVMDGDLTGEDQPPLKPTAAHAVVPLARESLQEPVQRRDGKIRRASFGG